jgi:hypothetical protein
MFLTPLVKQKEFLLIVCNKSISLFEISDLNLTLLDSKTVTSNSYNVIFHELSFYVLQKEYVTQFRIFMNAKNTKLLQIKQVKSPINEFNFRNFQTWYTQGITFWVETLHFNEKPQIKISGIEKGDIQVNQLSIQGREVEFVQPLTKSAYLLVVKDQKKIESLGVIQVGGAETSANFELMSFGEWDLGQRRVDFVWETEDPDCIMISTASNEVLIANYKQTTIIHVFSLGHPIEWALDFIYSHRRVSVLLLRKGSDGFEEMKLDDYVISKTYSQINLKKILKDEKLKIKEDRSKPDFLKNLRDQLKNQKK